MLSNNVFVNAVCHESIKIKLSSGMPVKKTIRYRKEKETHKSGGKFFSLAKLENEADWNQRRCLLFETDSIL